MQPDAPACVPPVTNPSDHFFRVPRALLPDCSGLMGRESKMAVELARCVTDTPARGGDVQTVIAAARLAEATGSWACRRQRSAPPRGVDWQSVEESLDKLGTAGIGDWTLSDRGLVTFRWAETHWAALGRGSTVGGGSGAYIKAPKALGSDTWLTGRELSIYLASCWGLFKFIGGGAGRWKEGVPLSYSLLSEWTGLCKRAVPDELRRLEAARLILRDWSRPRTVPARPGRPGGQQPLIRFVPIPVRYARRVGAPPGLNNRDLPLYIRLPRQEREARYARWRRLRQDVSEDQWNVLWSDEQSAWTGTALSTDALTRLAAA